MIRQARFHRRRDAQRLVNPAEVDLLKTLEEKSPANEKGQRPSKLHQWLTADIGDPMLSQQVQSLLTLQRLAIASGHGWKRFLYTVDRVLPKKDATMFLPFIDPIDS